VSSDLRCARGGLAYDGAVSVPSIEPPAFPDDNKPAQPKANTGAKKTLVTWVVLIAMFAAIYAFLTPSGDTAAAASPEPSSSAGGAPWVAVLVPSVMLVAFVYLTWWRSRGYLTYGRESSPGLIALREGKLDEAERALSSLAAKYKSPLVGAHARFNLATVHMRQGKLDAAEADFTAIERWINVGYMSDIRLLAAIGLTELFALRGKPELARRWLVDARKRYDRNLNGVHQLGSLVLAELLVLAREGKFREVIDGFDARRTLLDNSLIASEVRVGWAIRAFAAWRESDPRGHGAPEAALRQVRDHVAELAPRFSEWPEMRAFLETNA
jgi:hypothetical protein